MAFFAVDAKVPTHLPFAGDISLGLGNTTVEHQTIGVIVFNWEN